MSDTLTIERLGAQADGIADVDGKPVYVPFALPGESWRISQGHQPERLTSSPHRTIPPCQHFGTCGGCAAQHMSDDFYNEWKKDVVAQAFAHRGLQVDVAPLQRVAMHSRRRAYFGVSRDPDGHVSLGFREEGQHRLVDLSDCLILDAQITAALPALRELAQAILPFGEGARLLVTRLDHGLDVSFETQRKPLPVDTLQRVAALARAARVVRLSIGGEIVASEAPPTLTIGGVTIAPPPGVFLQAVPEAEQRMTDIMTAAVGKAKTVADLFSGVGTFTFALGRTARVTAVDGDKRAIATLVAAAKAAKGIKPITAITRDLFREPLTQRELAGFDAVVYDPPRAGAEAQSVRLAKSTVPIVVAVSCAPATLARDVRVLVDGGYKLKSVTPIDQFAYTPHIEAVAVLRR